MPGLFPYHSSEYSMPTRNTILDMDLEGYDIEFDVIRNAISESLRDASAEHDAVVEHRSVMFAMIKTLPPPYFGFVKRLDSQSGKWIMFQISDYYDKILLGPTTTYQGKSDFDIWSPEIAQAFEDNDFKLLESKSKTALVSEWFDSPFTGVSGVFNGVKWAFKVESQTYCAGIGVIDDSISIDQYKEMVGPAHG